MRGYQQEKRKGPLAFILRGGTHSSFLPGDFHGVTESDATEQLNTFTKEKPFLREKRGGGRKWLKEGCPQNPQRKHMAAGDSISLSGGSVLVKCGSVLLCRSFREYREAV